MGNVFDLATLDTTAKSNAGVRMPVIHPKTKEPTGMGITLLGMDSEAQRKYQRDYLDRLLALKEGDTKPEKEDEECRMLAVCTVGWDFDGGPVILDGQEFPLTPENAFALYKRFPWIKDAVDRFVGDRGNFLPD